MDVLASLDNFSLARRADQPLGLVWFHTELWETDVLTPVDLWTASISLVFSYRRDGALISRASERAKGCLLMQKDKCLSPSHLKNGSFVFDAVLCNRFSTKSYAVQRQSLSGSNRGSRGKSRPVFCLDYVYQVAPHVAPSIWHMVGWAAVLQ